MLSDRIRALLKDHPDGMSMPDMRQALNYPGDSQHFRVTLRNIYGVYIDRWEPASRGKWKAVYCLVPVPENCPMPSEKSKEPKPPERVEGFRVPE